MAKIKECYKVSINGEQMLIQVTRTEREGERNADGTINGVKWSKTIDKIMKTYFNTSDWTFIKNGEDKTIKIRLKI